MYSDAENDGDYCGSAVIGLSAAVEYYLVQFLISLQLIFPFDHPSLYQAPPLILLAGDCTGSAYVFAPRLTKAMKTNLENGKRYNDEQGEGCSGDVPNYELAFEIQCGATVGSAAVAAIPDGTGDVEIFVPSYEVNKVTCVTIHSLTTLAPKVSADLNIFHSFTYHIFHLHHLPGSHIPPHRQRLTR